MRLCAAKRHVGYLVQEERAGVRLFEQADLRGLAVAELLAEQFALHAFGIHRRRVDDDERTGRAAERSWIRRATRSLPDPGGPEIMIRLFVGATLSSEPVSCASTLERPTSS